MAEIKKYNNIMKHPEISYLPDGSISLHGRRYVTTEYAIENLFPQIRRGAAREWIKADPALQDGYIQIGRIKYFDAVLMSISAERCHEIRQKAMTLTELAEIKGLTKSQAFAKKNRGEFDHMQLELPGCDRVYYDRSRL